jgi:hypothetical protein
MRNTVARSRPMRRGGYIFITYQTVSHPPDIHALYSEVTTVHTIVYPYRTMPIAILLLSSSVGRGQFLRAVRSDLRSSGGTVSVADPQSRTENVVAIIRVVLSDSTCTRSSNT